MDGAALEPLQEALYAQAAGGSNDVRQRVLLVLQGMDTSGKGGVIEHVIGQVNPQGMAIHSFKSPTDEELAHHYLWRIRRGLPAPGQIGIFDRSHYEDVLIARVRRLVPKAVWEKRYAEINRFEARLADDGVRIIKCFLHISPEEQLERLRARLQDPSKYWKFNPGDVKERSRWTDYTRAYETVLERTNTDPAPWYVIPSDLKWYRNWAIGRLLLETLTDLDPQFPPADFDPAEQLALLDSTTV